MVKCFLGQDMAQPPVADRRYAQMGHGHRNDDRQPVIMLEYFLAFLKSDVVVQLPQADHQLMRFTVTEKRYRVVVVENGFIIPALDLMPFALDSIGQICRNRLGQGIEGV